MGRPKGSKNKRTLIQEAEENGGSEMLDSLHVMEAAMRYFYLRATQLMHNGGSPALIRENYIQAVAAAEKVAPYRHARLSAVKLAGDPNAPKEIGDGASIEELKALVEIHLEKLAPVLNLEVLRAPRRN
jgi:hypothetical protein